MFSKNSGSRDSLLASDSPEDFFTDSESRKLSSQSEPRKLSSYSDASCRPVWRKTSADSYDWSSRSSTLQSHWREQETSSADCDSSTLQSDWRPHPIPASYWSDCQQQMELLDTDSVERLNLPAPLQATPCTPTRQITSNSTSFLAI